MDDLGRWYEKRLGQALRKAEREVLAEQLQNIFGYHLLMLGAADTELLRTCRVQHCVMLRSREQGPCQESSSVFSDSTQLPLATDSVDAVLFNHSLDFTADPHQALREAERVLVPEGYLLILGFNPRSLWGLYRAVHLKRRHTPWNGRFRSVARIKDWVRLLGFEITATRYVFYRPPIQQEAILSKFRFMEPLMRRLLPFAGGVYLIVARKKVSTLTPIKPRWRPRRRLVTGVVDTASRLGRIHDDNRI